MRQGRPADAPAGAALQALSAVSGDHQLEPPLSGGAQPLDRQFQVTEPDRVYVVDITYVATGKGWLYFAVFLDQFLRQGMGWGLSAWMTTDLVMDDMQMSRWCPRPGKWAASAFRSISVRLLQGIAEGPGLVGSMSRNASCWDNAPAQSFFHTLKTELIHHRRFESREQAKQKFFEYIEVFYNRQSKHSTLGYPNPTEFG